MSNFGEGSQGGEETAVPAVGGGQPATTTLNGSDFEIVGKTKVFLRT